MSKAKDFDTQHGHLPTRAQACGCITRLWLGPSPCRLSSSILKDYVTLMVGYYLMKTLKHICISSSVLYPRENSARIMLLFARWEHWPGAGHHQSEIPCIRGPARWVQEAMLCQPVAPLRMAQHMSISGFCFALCCIWRNLNTMV